MRLHKPTTYANREIRRVLWAGEEPVDEHTLTWVHDKQDVGTAFTPALAFVPDGRTDVAGPWAVHCEDARAEFGRAMSRVLGERVPRWRNEGGNYIAEGVLRPPTLKIGVGNVIYPGVSFDAHVTIGNNCAIGGPGFNFWREGGGRPYRFPHWGGVRVGQHVHIHNGVNIDAGLLEPTSVGPYTTIDSNVFIAHDVRIGRGCTVVAGAALCGWAVLERNVWVSPNATVRNRVTMGEGSRAGLQANVVKDVDPHVTVIGNPAKPYSPAAAPVEANGLR